MLSCTDPDDTSGFHFHNHSIFITILNSTHCPSYKQLLHCDPAVLQTLLGLATPSDPRLKSGATSLERPLSSAVQTFQEKREDWPLKQSLPKTTALLQVSCQFKPGHWIHVLCIGQARNIAQYIDCFEGEKEGSCCCCCCCSTVYDQGQKSKTETKPWMPLSLCYTL